MANHSCANPKNLFKTAFIDSVAPTLLVQDLALADVATIQEQNFCLTMPNRENMTTDTTMCLAPSYMLGFSPEKSPTQLPCSQ